MANFIVVRADSERSITVVAKTDTEEEARTAMNTDFRHWFCEKTRMPSNIDDKTFNELYEEYEDNECELDFNHAWLNECNHVDFDWVILETCRDDILNHPLSMEQIILSTSDENTRINGYVSVSLSDIVNLDMDGFLDLIADKLTGNICLTDISYKPVDTTTDGQIILYVSGDASEIIEITDEILEKLKTNLFMAGTKALEDFTDMDLSAYDDKDTINSLLDQIIAQMPDDVLIRFCRKYLE